MTKDELEKIYQQLEYAAKALEDLAKLLRDIKERLASGGGPGPKSP
jgi:uncharacterized protein YukE